MHQACELLMRRRMKDVSDTGPWPVINYRKCRGYIPVYSFNSLFIEYGYAFLGDYTTLYAKPSFLVSPRS